MRYKMYVQANSQTGNTVCKKNAEVFIALKNMNR